MPMPMPIRLKPNHPIGPQRGSLGMGHQHQGGAVLAGLREQRVHDQGGGVGV